MNRDQFIKVINHMEQLHMEEEKVNSLLKEIDSEFGGGYIHNKTLSFLSNLLKELVNDEYDYIGYYLWEIDFGRGYYDGCITEADGSIIPLRNAEDLYNLITNNKAE